MSTAPVPSHLPRAGVDRITSQQAALSVVAMAIHRPLRHETIALLLDRQHRGSAVVVISGTEAPDDVIDVVSRLVSPFAHDGSIGAVVVASVRPGHPGAGAGEADIDRWLELSDIVHEAGAELLEWFVIDDAVTCPRDLLGEPPRWSSGGARRG
jgi:hypothetical protein